MTESTREKIKKAALSLFSRRGYDGTTLNDIAKEVGIKTPSLYAHFKGKGELFCLIHEDLVKEHVLIMNQIIDTAESMDIEAGLYYVFEQYIIRFVGKPEVVNFWTQVSISTPPELKDRLFPQSRDRDIQLEKRIGEIISKGIRQGKLRDDDLFTTTFSHRLMRDGALHWMSVTPELNSEKYIKAFWNNLWFGLKK